MSVVAEMVVAKKKGRPKKASGEGTPVRIDSDIVAKARYLSSLHDKSMSDIFSEILRPVIERRFREAGRDLLAEGDSKE